jgi:SAM-dependent methyltransferase
VPLPDQSVAAVLVGQAWHWFDDEQAPAQVRQALRPGGVLGLLWNVFNDRVPWVAELVAASAAEDRLSAMDDELPYDGEPVPERREFSHRQAMTRDLLVDNLASRSGTVLMAPAARVDLLRRARDLAPAEAFELPWVCDTWRAQNPSLGSGSVPLASEASGTSGRGAGS